MNGQTPTSSPAIDFDTPAAKRLRQFRRFKDKFAQYGIAVGGVSVIITILLIFLYLVSEVIPLFRSADVQAVSSYSLPVTAEDNSATLLMTIEEQSEISMRITESGSVIFFDVEKGDVLKSLRLPIPTVGAEITQVVAGSPGGNLIVVGYSNGQVLLAKHEYDISFEGDVRTITPFLSFPFGEDFIQVDPKERPLTSLAFADSDSKLTITAHVNDYEIAVAAFEKEENFITEELSLEGGNYLHKVQSQGPVAGVQIDPSQRWLFSLATSGQLIIYNLGAADELEEHSQLEVLADDIQATTMVFLLGGISLLIGDDSGAINQWFMVRDENNDYALEHVREFQLASAPITGLISEYRRKGFVAVDETGELGIFFTTSERRLYRQQLNSASINAIAISPRANALLLESASGSVSSWQVHNEHPEVSMHSLWQEVWYENYADASYIWQSSAATVDFEPKYSLMPLVFGTLKAAFYAMLLAAPLAICGAIYTAYFMAPALRRKVKPIIELMEALPTVILGFLAGLWLAPYLEANLPGAFALIVLVPIGILLFGFLWNFVPPGIRHSVPDGWHAVLLIPVVILVGWGALSLSIPIENIFFGGDLPGHLENEGWTYDQRNAMVVGAAMGFAVIPTIFSIAEDAIFSVPKHLTFGSLALGATPWQTLVRVVLPTASPGIFSALMIGLGRAVGETMIVLMATGNTPIMDANIFEGMRTLAANIAVEIPEAEVGGSHYRILFLSGLVLFLFTFIVNTVAETVRQRLRGKYGAL